VQTQEQARLDARATARQQLQDVLMDSDGGRHARLRALLDGAEADATDLHSMRQEIRQLWRWLEDTHGYLVAGPDEPADPRRLSRRIHFQRLALSDMNRLVRSEFAYRCRCLRSELEVDGDGTAGSGDTADVAALRAQVRRQRRVLRWVDRRLVAQGEELGRLLDRVIKQAATA
jgi:hypothetical protein